MAEEDEEEIIEEQGMSDDEIIKRIADSMKDTSALPEEKHNVYKFLHNVSIANDTTKVGYLRDDKELNEIGMPKHPIRTYKSLALISDKIMANSFFKEYFLAESEIITSTSLSRQGMLIKLAVVQRKEIADVTKPPKKENKGWFKKFNKEPQPVSEY